MNQPASELSALWALALPQRHARLEPRMSFVLTSLDDASARPTVTYALADEEEDIIATILEGLPLGPLDDAVAYAFVEATDPARYPAAPADDPPDVSFAAVRLLALQALLRDWYLLACQVGRERVDHLKIDVLSAVYMRSMRLRVQQALAKREQKDMS